MLFLLISRHFYTYDEIGMSYTLLTVIMYSFLYIIWLFENCLRSVMFFETLLSVLDSTFRLLSVCIYI